MLKIFTGEHLENVQNCESLGLNEFDSQKTIISAFVSYAGYDVYNFVKNKRYYGKTC